MNNDKSNNNFYLVGAGFELKASKSYVVKQLATCNTPEQIIQNSLHNNNSDSRLINIVYAQRISEDDYLELKKDAHNKFKQTLSLENKGKISNFSENYMNLLNPRDLILK
jgi:hypothetical protein